MILPFVADSHSENQESVPLHFDAYFYLPNKENGDHLDALIVLCDN